MNRLRLDTLRERLRLLITEPLSELNRWQRALRFAVLLGIHGARRLRQGRAPEMAGALAFRTLFGLLPVLVVATLLVRAFQGWQGFYENVDRIMEAVGLSGVTVSTPDGGTSVSLGQWLLDLLGQVESLSLTAIGWVGVAVLIYSALGLMITIENSFNSLYQAPRGRSWARRLPNYWFVLCLAPAAVATTMYVDDRVDSLIRQFGAWNWLLNGANWFWSLAVTWLIMLAIYKLVPNTSVANRAAMAGAGVAAVLLLAGKASLGAYLQNALSLRQMYGSLGLIPLFMFWVYLMWLVVLYGLEVAAILQTVSRTEIEEAGRERERQRSGLIDPAAVLTLAEFVAERFRDGRTTEVREIIETLGLPPETVDKILIRLVEEDVLHRLDRSPTAVVLARPPESISARRLVDIGFELVDEGRPEQRSRLLESLRAAQREVASRTTLGALVQ